MNGIMGMAKLLADTKLSPEQQTYVGAVSTSASALLALIEDLLDYSKIEAGRFELGAAADVAARNRRQRRRAARGQGLSPRASGSAAMSRPTCRNSSPPIPAACARSCST